LVCSAFLGRTFRDEESQPGKDRVVLLGEDVWRKLYNAERADCGQTLTIKSQTYTIVGVIAARLLVPADDSMQIWSPAAITAANRSP